MNTRMIAALLILGIAIFAWGNPPQSTSAIVGFNQTLPTQTSLSACTWPAGAPTNTGLTAICPVFIGGVSGLATSYQGAPFALAAGAQGPAGPAGPAGPTGATGPQGPAGTIPTTFTCTSLATGSAGVTLSGCP
jgi:hypothetical protein